MAVLPLHARLLLSALPALLVASRPAAAQAGEATIDDLGWMAGCWYGTQGAAQYEEH